jgi:hypothetical protein
MRIRSENLEKSVALEFLLYRQVYQSDFIAKCMSHEGFLARRGVLELAALANVYRSLYIVWQRGWGCLSTPLYPPLWVHMLQHPYPLT